VADSTSSSSLHPKSACRINSTPILQSNGGISKSSNRRGIRIDEKIEDHESKIRKCPSLNHSLPFANSQHPIIDISNLNYKAYRHKLIEATLRKQYDDIQPPGDVVLNSLHLNSADSVIGVRLNDRYDHSLFDFVEEYYNVAEATSQKNVKRLHPLDHFLSKGGRRPRTSEEETETISDNGVNRENSRNHLPENIDSNPILSSMDDNGNPCVRAPPNDVLAIAMTNRDFKSEVPILRRSSPTQSRKHVDKTITGHNMENDCPQPADPSTKKESSWTRNDRSASAENTSKVSLSRAATSLERREATGSGTNADRSHESKKKLEDYPPAVFPLSSKCRLEKEAEGRSNFMSVSSSEIASIRSDSSKRRENEVSCCSHESSISPKNRVSSRPPWMSGNRGTSFNRKYGGNITEISAARVAGPMSARGSGLQKLTVSSRGRSKESSTMSTSRNPTLPGRRAASFVASRGKEFIGMTIEQQRGENQSLVTRPRGQRSKSKDVRSVAVAKDDEEGRTLKTTDLPSREKMSATSFLSPARTLVRPRKRSSQVAFSNVPVTASETLATKEPELITSRSGTDAARGRSVFENNAPRPGPESPLVQDRRKSPAKLNRGGRRRLRSAENPSKGASLSPQIELSAEVLNPADDTDKSAIPDGEKLTGLTSRIDSWENMEAGKSEEIQAGCAKAKGIDVKSNSTNDIARSPKIIPNLQMRTASVNNLPKSRGSAAASHPARRDANSETKSGLNGTKLNTRSNGAVNEMRYDEFPRAEASSLAPRECGNVVEAKETRQDDIAGRDADEELHLPRHDSKIGLAMNSALKRYIKMLKQGLLNHGDKDGVALASLSLSDAISILSEQRTPLSPEEIQELQTVLDKIERNPELLCKLSCPSMESVL